MRFSHYRRPLFLLLVCWAAGIVALRYMRPEDARRSGPFPPFPVRVEGRVAQYPVLSGGRWRFVLDKLSSPGAGTAVMAYASDLGGASYGDRVAFTAGLGEPFNYAVPGNLDWRGYLAERGIYAEARGDRLEIVKKAPFPLGVASRVRARTLEIFEKNFNPEQSSVLAGMVLGEKKSVSDELRAAFQDSGAMHLLVASGSNVGFVTFLVFFFCTRLGIRKKYSGPAAMACAGFYVLAAGLEAPLVRGYLMFSALLAGYLLDRDSGVFQGLVIACFAILILDPAALFDASFQMSFIASFGITVGMTLWDGLMPLRGPALYVSRLLLVSFFAQAGLYPLMALYFHKISLVSILSNVLLVPLSGIIMGLGFSALLVSWQPAMFAAVRILTEFALEVFIWLLKMFAAFKYSSVLVSPPSGLMLAAFLALVLVLLHAPLLGFRRARLYAFAAVPLLAVSAAWLMPRKNLVSAFSGQDTRSVILRYGGNGLFLFNPGISGSKLANAALFYGSREVEAAFVSTLSRRDWRGLDELSKLIKIKRVVVPYGARPPELAEALQKMAAGGTTIERAWPGDTLFLCGLEVRPRRSAAGAARPGPDGYSGDGRLEGLDWAVRASGFEVLVLDGGSRVSVAGSASGRTRVLDNRPGKASEMVM